jgi:hypothetical protein
MHSLFGWFLIGFVGTLIIKGVKGKKLSLGGAILGGVLFMFIWPLATAAFGLALNLLFLAAFLFGFLFLIKWLLK